MEMIGENDLLSLLQNLDKEDPVIIDDKTKELANIAIKKMFISSITFFYSLTIKKFIPKKLFKA